MRKCIIVLSLILLIVPVFSGCKEARKLRTGERLPTVALVDINGNRVAVPDDLRGDVVVLLFWKEGCRFCQEGMPATGELYKKYSERGFEFVAIQVGGSQEKGKALVSEHGLTFPMLYDRESLVLGEYNIFGTPTMFFIDGQGLLTEKILGDLDAETLEELVLEKL